MNWIIASSLMFLLSLVLYSVTRKLQNDGVNNFLITYAMGAAPVVFMFIAFIIEGENLNYPPEVFLFWALVGTFSTYLGIKLSVLGIKNSPNPGYSLIIQKSYAPYTALASIILFADKLPMDKLLIIILTVCLISILILGKNNHESKSSRPIWIAQSFAAFFLFGNIAFMSRHLINSYGVPAVTNTMMFFAFSTICFTIDYAKKFSNTDFKKLGLKNIAWLVSIALSSALFNIFMIKAFVTTPNVGYVNIINASSIAALSVTSAVLFKDKLTIQNAVTIFGTVIALALLVT